MKVMRTSLLEKIKAVLHSSHMGKTDGERLHGPHMHARAHPHTRTPTCCPACGMGHVTDSDVYWLNWSFWWFSELMLAVTFLR